MSFRRFLVLLAVPSALAVAASCAPVALFSASYDGYDGPGAGGGATDTGTVALGGGTGGLTLDAGGDVATAQDPSHSFQVYCGGAQVACVPGATADTCGQDGIDSGVTVSCQVVPLADTDGGVTAECGVAGTSPEGGTCTKAADCAPELGCMAGLVPTCRSYCCDSPDSCPPDTYCVPSPMFEAPQDLIPVCIPVMKCKLLQDGTTCPAGLTCAIVRGDGTTSCVTPGTGTEGQSCPCAAGYTCSESDGTCLKLCDVQKPDCPGTEICQGATYPYPSGVGFCVK